MKQELITIINNMQQKRILVIGDLLLDKYIWGVVDHVSSEAPVAVVEVEKETHVPGGAANVASNIVALGGKAQLMGIMGNDKARTLFIAELEKQGIGSAYVLFDEKKPTIQKIRIMAQQQQLLRVDYEDMSYLENTREQEFLSQLELAKGSFDAIVVSDYAKGVITASLMQGLLFFCKRNNIGLIVDPKPMHKSFYVGASVVTPNHKEACELAGVPPTNDDTHIIFVGKKIQQELQANILLTRGEKGITVFDGSQEPVTLAIHAKEVYDVTGAGDTVVAISTLALCAGATLVQAATLANVAAGIVVGKLGTATVSAQELAEAVQKM